MNPRPVICSIQYRHIMGAFKFIPNVPWGHPARHRATAGVFRAVIANTPTTDPFIANLSEQIADHEQLADLTRWTEAAS